MTFQPHQSEDATLKTVGSDKERISMLDELQRKAEAAGPSRRLFLSFACNDGRNGLFEGRARACVLEGPDWELEIDADDWENGWAFTVDNAMLRIRLHRQWFPIVREKEWYGNWCWNRYEMKRPAGVRLLQAMRGKWTATCGPTLLYEWFNRKRESLNALEAVGNQEGKDR